MIGPQKNRYLLSVKSLKLLDYHTDRGKLNLGFYVLHGVDLISSYSRTPLIRPPAESHWCGRIRGMVAREGFVYEQKPLSVTRNVVV